MVKALQYGRNGKRGNTAPPPKPRLTFTRYLDGQWAVSEPPRRWRYRDPDVRVTLKLHGKSAKQFKTNPIITVSGKR